MRQIPLDQVLGIMEATWNSCIDYHNNQGDNDVKYPDLSELKRRLVLRGTKYEFRKIKKLGEQQRQDSFPLESEEDYDTIGLYKNNEDGTQTYLDEMTPEEFDSFHKQLDFESVLTKLNRSR